MPTHLDDLWALVLAGGDGTRLQALTRLLTGAPIPKQYCRILGERSLLESTLDRVAALVPAARTLVVVTHAHLGLARPQVARLPAENLLVQPTNRDTGPGILLSLLELARRAPSATVAVFPSDHDVRGAEAFRGHVHEMAAVVARHPDRVVLLGARPDHADTGYGYVAPGGRVGGVPGSVFRVRTFHEKPAADVARRLIRRGGLWNSFVMVGRVARLLALLAEVVPGAYEGLAPLAATPGAVAAAYDALAPWNFSRDFLQHIPRHLLVVRGEHLGWSDWGTPEAIERSLLAEGIEPPWRRPAAADAWPRETVRPRAASKVA
jgi:mannose-1-phosphate guanylyltransferase